MIWIWIMLGVFLICVIGTSVVLAFSGDGDFAWLGGLIYGGGVGLVLMIPIYIVCLVLNWTYADEIAANTVVTTEVVSVNGIYEEETDNGKKIVWADSNDDSHSVAKHLTDNHNSERWEVEITTTKVTNGWEWIAEQYETTDYVFYVPTKALYGNE